MPKRSCLCSPGFSLVELLTVLAILVLIMTSLRPAISSLTGAADLTKAASDLAAFYELARNEAMARNTYVWVGLATDAAGPNPRLAAAMVGSRDGTADFSASNLDVLARPAVFENLRAASETMAGQANGAVAQRVGEIAGSEGVGQVMEQTGAMTFSAERRTFTDTVTFTPQGDAVLAGAPTARSPVSPFLAVYLQKMRGATAGREQAAILIQGPGGGARVIRE
jgi:prepilin-type N-terminal cleavage/methylation domain-containing protein